MATPRPTPGGTPALAFEGLADAVTGVTASLSELGDIIRGTVAAFAPSAANEFSQAMKDLTATIGSALTPALGVLSSVAREVGGVLLPTMQKLTPIFTTLANAIGNYVTGAARQFGAVLEALAPILQIVADGLNMWSKLILDISSIMTAAIKVAGDLLSTFFSGAGGGIKDGMKQFLDVIREAVKSLVTFVATLAVFAGFRDTVKSFAAAIAKEAKDRDARAGGLLAAGNNPAITDIASILKQQQLAAFIAQGGAGGREKSDTDFLRDISAAVEKTATGDSFGEAIDKWYKDKFMGSTFGRLVDGLFSVLADIKRFFSNPFGR